MNKWHNSRTCKGQGGQMKCQGGRENELLPMEMKQLLRSFFCLDFKFLCDFLVYDSFAPGIILRTFDFDQP